MRPATMLAASACATAPGKTWPSASMTTRPRRSNTASQNSHYDGISGCLVQSDCGVIKGLADVGGCAHCYRFVCHRKWHYGRTFWGLSAGLLSPCGCWRGILHGGGWDSFVVLPFCSLGWCVQLPDQSRFRWPRLGVWVWCEQEGLRWSGRAAAMSRGRSWRLSIRRRSLLLTWRRRFGLSGASLSRGRASCRRGFGVSGGQEALTGELVAVPIRAWPVTSKGSPRHDHRRARWRCWAHVPPEGQRTSVDPASGLPNDPACALTDHARSTPPAREPSLGLVFLWRLAFFSP